MRKRVKNNLITLSIIILIIIASLVFLSTKKTPEISEETAKCIGEKTILFTQLGCTHCEAQKELFGDNIKYLNIIDCFYKNSECSKNNITAVPTWKINDNYYKGTKTIEELKELTGCGW